MKWELEFSTKLDYYSKLRKHFIYSKQYSIAHLKNILKKTIERDVSLLDKKIDAQKQAKAEPTKEMHFDAAIDHSNKNEGASQKEPEKSQETFRQAAAQDFQN